MLKLIESSKKNIENSSEKYICKDDLYGILLKTGKYLDLKDIDYDNMTIQLFRKMLVNYTRRLKKKNKTLLHYSLEQNLKEIAGLLISKGADVNSKDVLHSNKISSYWIIPIENQIRSSNQKKRTPLHIAAEKNFKGIGELLISKGADINVKTNEGFFLSSVKGGKSPLHFAAEHNSKDIGELLISKGADINITDIYYDNMTTLYGLLYRNLYKGNSYRNIELRFIMQQSTI